MRAPLVRIASALVYRVNPPNLRLVRRGWQRHIDITSGLAKYSYFAVDAAVSAASGIGQRVVSMDKCVHWRGAVCHPRKALVFFSKRIPEFNQRSCQIFRGVRTANSVMQMNLNVSKAVALKTGQQV